MKETDHIVSEIIRKGDPCDIVIEEENLIKKLVSDDEPVDRIKIRNREFFVLPFQKGFRLLLIIATLVASAAFVLHYSFIYLKDVLMGKNELYVNSAGAFTPKKTIGREYGIYLFNTSELWADSGIRIAKGDYVRISHSGAFHSSFADLLDGTRDNIPTPEIDWIGKEDYKDSTIRIVDVEKQAKKDEACLYNSYFQPDTIIIPGRKLKPRHKTIKKTQDRPGIGQKDSVHLGDILFAIAPEYVSDDPIDQLKYAHVWSQNDVETSFEAEQTGILRFAVNDIYFKSETELKEYPQKVDSLRSGKKFDPERILTTARKDTTNIKDFRKIFYIDNVGQILVCVEIQHPLKHGFWNPMTAYRYLENKAYKNIETKNLTWGIFLSIVTLIFVFLPWVTLIFASWMLIIFVSIYIVFLIFFGIEFIIMKIKKLKEKLREKRKRKTEEVH